MAINPYEILGVNQYMSLDEITLEFTRLKCELSEAVLQEGKAGAVAAKRLQQVKEAYAEIEYLKRTDATKDDRPLGKVEDLIKEGNYLEAQQILDAQMDRGAEWHYIQSALFYRQGWLTESKLQLQLAKSLQPENEKYSKAYDNLIDVMKNGFPDRAEFKDIPRSYPTNQRPKSAGSTCCNFCGTLLIIDCCCNCLGCK